MALRICAVCGKEFSAKNSQINRRRENFNGGTYCSRECQNIGRVKRIIKVCPNCGESFEVIPSKGKQIYCTAKCRWGHEQRYKTTTRYAGNIKKKCLHCGKEFLVYPSNQDKKYCSVKCYHESKISLIEKTCPQCGNKFLTQPSEMRRGGGKFCSKDCFNKSIDAGLYKRCLMCGKPFKTMPCFTHKGFGKFCSQKCSSTYLSGENAPGYGRLPGHGKQGVKPDLGHYVRSSWEANYARVLIFKGIPYQYEPKTFILEKENGSKATYTPDFFIGHWVEVKGWWRDEAKEKVRLFKAQYPEEKLEIVGKPEYMELERRYKKLIANWE